MANMGDVALLSKLNVLAVVPARSGSKGIPRKNIMNVRGKPLMSYAIQAAKNAELIKKVIVSTDSEEFADIARSFGAEVPFFRPQALSGDRVPLWAVCQHAMQYFDNQGQHYDAVLSVQATAPLTSPRTLDAMIEKMERTGCEAVTTACEVRHEHPYIVHVLGGQDGDEARPFLELPPDTKRYPRQVRPTLHVFTGTAFLRRRQLLEMPDATSNALGNSPRVVSISNSESVNIDDETDVQLAEFFLGIG